MNIFVGLLQVLTPTFLIFTAGGDADVVRNAPGLYLFGWTYLYVAFNQLMRPDAPGPGYLSLFVAVCAVVYSGLHFFSLGDPAFGVIWLYWAFLWALFFVVLGLGFLAPALVVFAVVMVGALYLNFKPAVPAAAAPAAGGVSPGGCPPRSKKEERNEHAEECVAAGLQSQVHRAGTGRSQPVAPGHPGAGQRPAG